MMGIHRDYMIGLFADSHGDTDSLERLLRKMGPLDAVLFLGDINRDAEYLEALLQEEAQNPPVFFAVQGNNDFGREYPGSLVVCLNGQKIWMEHGHMTGCVRDVADHARQNGAGIAVFGHTHHPMVDMVGGILVVNPGSAGRYVRGGPPRASCLILGRGTPKIQDVFLGL